MRRWNPGAEVYTARTRLIDRAPSGALLAFCGTGNPKAFVADLCVAGAKVIATRFFPDHHRYARADLRAIESQARDAGAEALVTTEKDDVNLPAELRARPSFPLRAIRMEMDVEGGEALIDRILEVQSLKSKVQSR
jgi:tetraacyldisaccharide 4'-kinase